MNRKKILLAVSMVLLPQIVLAETDNETRSAYNAVFAEFLGPGLLGSINYDRMLNEHLSLRTGFAFAVDEREVVPLFPIGINCLLGPGDHKLEAGLTVTVHQWSYILWVSGGFGYRYAPKAGGLIFRLTATPIIVGGRVQPWGGVSLGFQF